MPSRKESCPKISYNGLKLSIFSGKDIYPSKYNFTKVLTPLCRKSENNVSLAMATTPMSTFAIKHVLYWPNSKCVVCIYFGSTSHKGCLNP